MSYLHIAAIVAACLATLCLGIAAGCKVNGDRHETGVLSIAVGSLFSIGALVFWWV